MKTLLLVRHAKSSWGDPTLEDHRRELLPKGIKRTAKMCSFLKEKGIQADVLVSSHAVRAYETAKIIADALNYPTEKIQINEGLYYSGYESMENLIFEMDDSVDVLMLVGHNPDMTNFANEFLVEKLDYLATSAVVCVDFETEAWNDIFLCKRNIRFCVKPKEID